MTIEEFKNLSDEEVRKVGVNKLYASNRLSNANIDCFLIGFRTAIEMMQFNSIDLLDRIEYCIEQTIEDIKTECAYSGRALTNKEHSTIEKLEKVSPEVKNLWSTFISRGVELTVK